MKNENLKINLEEKHLELLYKQEDWTLKERKIKFYFNLGIIAFLICFWCYVVFNVSVLSIPLGVAGTVLAFTLKLSLSAFLNNKHNEKVSSLTSYKNKSNRRFNNICSKSSEIPTLNNNESH